ncbi:flagellar biosynthetic protein FliO [Ferrimonas pelagia]|uniref:Flagellar protein n=1 Tax=Ferrimonas pelagia TaxID=1177826 RepID=A0ABP9EBB8_9GAMM
MTYRWIGPAALLSAALPLAAEPAAGSSDQIATIAASLVGIVAFILLLGFLARRINLPSSLGAGQLKAVAMMPVGNRERIAVVQVGEQQYLVGITGSQISLLDKLEQPLAEPQANQFGQLLAKFNQKQER